MVPLFEGSALGSEDNFMLVYFENPWHVSALGAMGSVHSIVHKRAHSWRLQQMCWLLLLLVKGFSGKGKSPGSELPIDNVLGSILEVSRSSLGAFSFFQAFERTQAKQLGLDFGVPSKTPWKKPAKRSKAEAKR